MVQFIFFRALPTPPSPPLQECVDPIFMGRAGPLVPNFWHILTERVQFYLMVQFTLARALPSPPGHPSGNVLIPYLRREQVPWGRIFNIFWQSASSSTLWYSLFLFARFQPQPASPLRECVDPIFTGRAGPLGPNFKHILTERLQFYLMVQFTLARALPTPPEHPSGNVLIPYLGGEQVSWGRIFNIFWQSASSSTLWYSLFFFARFQPHPAPLRECVDPIFTGRAGPLGPNF